MNVTILVDQRTAYSLNTGREVLEDIIVMHTENGKDHFIAITANWLPSCFGNSIDLLCSLVKPIRSYSILELKEISLLTPSTDITEKLTKDTNPFDGPLPQFLQLDKMGLSVPKEIWRLVDFIYKFGMDVVRLKIVN